MMDEKSGISIRLLRQFDDQPIDPMRQAIIRRLMSMRADMEFIADAPFLDADETHKAMRETLARWSRELLNISMLL